MNKGNTYLSNAERNKIEVLLKAGYKKTEIAQILGRSLKTIYNEINRGTVDKRRNDWSNPVKVYDAYAGARVARQNAHLKGRPDKLSTDSPTLLKIENQILIKRYSPASAIAVCCTDEERICKGTLYNYIYKRKFDTLTYKHLSVRKKRKKKETEPKVSYRNMNGRTIEERDKSIMSRTEYGHWEMDTVVGSRGNSKACLLVLTERKTRYELIFKIKDRTQLSVKKAPDRYERKIGYRRFKNTFLTITCDNGVEFINQDLIETSQNGKHKRTILYYAHPYSSFERGSNENNNKLIRRWLPKGKNLEKVTETEVQFIQEWINGYPREMFGWESSAAMLSFEHCGRGRIEA